MTNISFYRRSPELTKICSSTPTILGIKLSLLASFTVRYITCSRPQHGETFLLKKGKKKIKFQSRIKLSPFSNTLDSAAE